MGTQECRETCRYPSALSSVNCDTIWFYVEFKPIKYQHIYEVHANNIIDKMVDSSKSKDDITTTSTRTAEAANFYDTVRQNWIRIVDEFEKVQPQYSQSVSNLQLNCIAAAMDSIQSMVSAQRLFSSNGNVPPVVTPPYTNEFVKQSNEITDNIVKAVRINYQLTVNAINAAAENFRTLDRTIESVTEYNTNAAKAWNSFATVQQQQFLYKQ